MKRWTTFLLVLSLAAVLAAGSFLKSAAFKKLGPEAQQAIVLVAKSREAAPRLARYPGWTAGAERQDGAVWYVWFERDDEWLGEAYVDLESRKVSEVNIPVDPTPAERARMVPKLRKLVRRDAEVKALLGDEPGEWEEEINYDKWEDTWFVYYWRGDDAVGVRIGQDGGRYYVDDVFDPLALKEEQARRHDQDRAIQLAYTAERVGELLEPYDDWKAYAEPASQGRWTVSFATPEKTILTAAVDLAGGKVLAVETP
ncbi:MAG TPA: hypothetical protein ENJ85_03780 [Oceanithermus profundus]|uniref:PepSY domain-containing protein n=1 Tax=Oceanithermus profundus TaxID=187137 RepID=A0A7C5WRP0_9DEIN|nr:hypothetical protein [Oceanithermus profundus]